MKKSLELLKWGRDYLAGGGLANPQQEAEVFLSRILNRPRIALYLDNLPVEQSRLNRYRNLLNLRARGRPLQYLLGSTEFMGLEFKVGPGVFIPRPETEILVETVLRLSAISYQPSAKILDLGTGCGNIAISLAKYLKTAQIFAGDISEVALEFARANSRRHNLKISFIKSNLLAACKEINYFSLIVSNPPYIEAGQIPGLPVELHYEPQAAYDGGPDGLYYYRRIVNEAPDYLQEEGWLVLELGDAQVDAVSQLLKANGKLAPLSVVRDYNGIKRVICAQKIRKPTNG